MKKYESKLGVSFKVKFDTEIKDSKILLEVRNTKTMTSSMSVPDRAFKNNDAVIKYLKEHTVTKNKAFRVTKSRA